MRLSSAGPALAAMDKRGLQQQWWDDARRVSHAATSLNTDLMRPSRSASSSPVPEEVLQAVALRRSICSGTRHGPAAAAAASTSAPGLGGQSGPLPLDPWRGSGGEQQLSTPQQAQPQRPQMRRSMLAAGSPPPSAQGAYVSNREAASSLTARSAEKEQLLSYLQARSSTMSRMLGSPTPTALTGLGAEQGVGTGLLLMPPPPEPQGCGGGALADPRPSGGTGGARGSLAWGRAAGAGAGAYAPPHQHGVFV
ncbi:hypothetical protein MNEG_12086, partial [Monoraphidium neglectum]